jgi:hypothetical protein
LAHVSFEGGFLARKGLVQDPLPAPLSEASANDIRDLSIGMPQLDGIVPLQTFLVLD